MALEMMILHISLVPSAMVSICASRKHRSTSNARESPFAPCTCRALFVTSHASSVLISFAAATLTALCGTRRMYCSAAEYTALFAAAVFAYISASMNDMP